MIAEERWEGAIRALQAIMIRARTMAYEGADHRQIADLMDGGEYLAALMVETNECTEEYRAYLVEVATKHKCLNAVQYFDGVY